MTEQAYTNTQKAEAPEGVGWGDLTDEQVERLYALVEAKGAFLTLEDIERIDAGWREEGRNRRAALLMLTEQFWRLRELVKGIPLHTSQNP